MSAPPVVRGHAFVLAAFAASVSIVGVLAFLPFGTSVQESARVEIGSGAQIEGDQEEQRREVQRHTLVEAEGWGLVAAITAPPILLTGLALLLRRGVPAVVARMVSSLLLLVGVVLGMLSIGIFYLPTALLMLIAAGLALADRTWRRDRVHA